ncbi:MAG: hypothetical protein MST10_03840 [Lentisphaeria bacterium]|nr:hypothetical protein [Lentisphaeria bacterium]
MVFANQNQALQAAIACCADKLVRVENFWIEQFRRRVAHAPFPADVRVQSEVDDTVNPHFLLGEQRGGRFAKSGKMINNMHGGLRICDDDVTVVKTVIYRNPSVFFSIEHRIYWHPFCVFFRRKGCQFFYERFVITEFSCLLLNL